MAIRLGLLGFETDFNFAIVEYNYQLHGAVHTTPSGAKRVQYAKEDKYLFTIKLTFVDDDIWEDVEAEIKNSKLYDLNLIIGADSYTVRFVPELILKMPILGTAEGYDITFHLQEV